MFLAITPLELNCSYTHLGNNRIKHSKSKSISSGINYLTRKLDEFGKSIIAACHNFLKSKGADQALLAELSGAITRLRKTRVIPAEEGKVETFIK